MYSQSKTAYLWIKVFLENDEIASSKKKHCWQNQKDPWKEGVVRQAFGTSHSKMYVIVIGSTGIFLKLDMEGKVANHLTSFSAEFGESTAVVSCSSLELEELYMLTHIYCVPCNDDYKSCYKLTLAIIKKKPQE